MASLTQLYVHCVWATWDRLPLISPAIEPRLYASISAKCIDLGATILGVGGMADHIHVLIQFPATITLARLVGETKGAGSHLMTHELQLGTCFKWQGSYGAFTISRRSIPQVQHYILNQKAHHAQGQLLDDFELTYDPDNFPRDPSG